MNSASYDAIYGYIMNIIKTIKRRNLMNTLANHPRLLHGLIRFGLYMPLLPLTNKIKQNLSKGVNLDLKDLLNPPNGDGLQPTGDGLLPASDMEDIPFGSMFHAKDLDLTDLGGQVSWVAPADRAQVSQYVVYLAEACQDREYVQFYCTVQFRSFARGERHQVTWAHQFWLFRIVPNHGPNLPYQLQISC